MDEIFCVQLVSDQPSGCILSTKQRDSSYQQTQKNNSKCPHKSVSEKSAVQLNQCLNGRGDSDVLVDFRVGGDESVIGARQLPRHLFSGPSEPPCPAVYRSSGPHISHLSVFRASHQSIDWYRVVMTGVVMKTVLGLILKSYISPYSSM